MNVGTRQVIIGVFSIVCHALDVEPFISDIRAFTGSTLALARTP